MKFLLDQNISAKLVEQLRDLYPNIMHTSAVNLSSATDSQVWKYAKENRYIIVSKDADFRQMSFLYGGPPKVIWLNLGNASTSDIQATLRKSFVRIRDFCESSDASFLVLGKPRRS